MSLASSFPEKYSLPEVAQQVAARKALAVLKKTHSSINIPITQDMSTIAERLEKVSFLICNFNILNLFLNMIIYRNYKKIMLDFFVIRSKIFIKKCIVSNCLQTGWFDLVS